MRFLTLIFPLLFSLADTRLTPSSQPDTVGALIERLGDPDPSNRAQAAELLRRRGEAARPALIVAARDPNPSIATAAGEILLALPWYRSDDPPAVRESLRSYGRADPQQRQEYVLKIASSYPQSIANQVLLRLLLEEPNEDVCWRIVSALRHSMDRKSYEALRQLEPSSDRSAALVLAGRACFLDDRPRAHALLRAAVVIESRRPTDDLGELDFAFDALVGAQIAACNYDQAAELRRMQTTRVGASDESSSEPVYQLLMLHARYGPLAGFSQDLRTYARWLAQPQALYAMSVLYHRCGQSGAAAACAQAAVNSSLTSRNRQSVIPLLQHAHLDDLLARELMAISQANTTAPALERANACLALVEIATRHDDHATAAQHLQRALDILEQSGRAQEVPEGIAILRSSIQHRLYRASLARNDPAAEQHLTNLLSSRSFSSEIITDMVPHLNSIGRQHDAQRIFQIEYQKLRARISQESGDAVLLNTLAWLCARSGQRLDEALDLAKRAVQTAPAEPAYIDTLAEAHFQLGNCNEAIRLEESALELLPGDPFMSEQLERFKQAKERN